jgi:fermentation-respiration switch protein FrsA (DUF1100 family)
MAARPHDMLRLLHLLIVGVYSVLPAAVVIVLLLRWRRRGHVDGAGRAPGLPLASVAVTFIAGLACSVSLCLIYARTLSGHVSISQMLLGTYFAAGMLLVLRGFDAGLLWVLRRALFLRRPTIATEPTVGRGFRVLVMYLARTVILVGVGLPYVMAAVMVYRPKVTPLDDPRVQLGFDFERVEFTASDGTRLVGWWMPAQASNGGGGPRRRGGSRLALPTTEDFGRDTVIVCHGLAASKSNQLILGRRLVPAGYNVLAFDFRAHGESGGQLTGFGAIEKRDVLAAVRWVREHHPDESRKVFGVGASMGASALIAAAADPSADGQAISAIATYAAYDDFDLLVHDVSKEYFENPLGWLLEHVGVPIASAHAGVNLTSFAPARDVANVWPRPILFIHGQQDEIIPFVRGHNLFDFASQPKFYLWYPKGTHNDIVADEPAAGVVAEFFRRAKAEPVI